MLRLEMSVFRRGAISFIPPREKESIISYAGLNFHANSLNELSSSMGDDIFTSNSLAKYLNSLAGRCLQTMKEHES